jgi:UDP-N-acetyl-D-glucosamine dehydrogenase
MSKTISIVGLGYIGLPLALAASNNGHHVIGIDTDQFKIDQINKGISPIEDVSNAQLNLALKNAKFMATNSFEFIQDSEITIICVPTPLGTNRKPDLSYVEKAIELVSPYLRTGSLIVLESTVAPGTTRNHIGNYIATNSKMTHDQFFVAFSPERIDPMNKDWKVENTPKIISGINQQSLDKAYEFYSAFISNL